MPSTFSPSLRIELIGAGEQAGTWSATTNTNLGTLIETAIAGVSTVSVTTMTQALVYADGATDQARNAVLRLTTSLVAAFAVYVPPFPKQYTVFNDSPRDATIFNSTTSGNTINAGAGVTVPAGRTMTVWSNGASFALQNTNFVGPLLGNVTGNVTGNAATATAATTQPFTTNNTTISTTAFVQAALQALHPVGSVYINASNGTNPASLFGFGTWASFGAGRVPVGFNAADPLFDTPEETGGSKDAVLVSHQHSVTGSGTTGNNSVGHNHGFNATTGDNNQSHNHSGTVDTTALSGGISGISEGFNSQGSAAGVFNKVAGPSVFSPTNGDLSPGGGVSFQANHNHTFTTNNNSNNHQHNVSGTTANNSVEHNHAFSVAGSTNALGVSSTNENLQPYITVYMWKRTA